MISCETGNCYAGHASPFSLFCHMYKHTQEYCCFNDESAWVYSLSLSLCQMWSIIPEIPVVTQLLKGIPCIFCTPQVHYFVWKSANSRAFVSLHNMLALQWKVASPLPIYKDEGPPLTGFPQLVAYICSYVGLPRWHMICSVTVIHCKG